MQVAKEYIQDAGQQRILEIYLKQSVIPKLVLCLAAPGTGKTTTIVRLLKILMDMGKDAPIKRFLALTFTKRTRDDILRKFQQKGMKDRIPSLQRVVRNFHSLAFSTLFWDQIITDKETSDKLEQIAAKTNLNMNGYDKLKVFKLAKTIKEAIAHDTIQQTIQRQTKREPTIGNIMQAYIDWLQSSYLQSRSISYDYSLIKCKRRLESGWNPRKIDLNNIELLIVDEFQDSNPAQMGIVKSILAKNPNMKLLMLGDIDQTIFTWRGADLIALDNFISEYDKKKDYEKVTLKNTHRLGSAVLQVSQKLIRSRDGYLQFRNKYYQDYRPKPLNVENNHSPLVIKFQSEYSEVNWVIKKIRQLVDAKNGINYKDITVLLRSFQYSHFFNKFKFQNSRLATINKTTQIPYTLKTDEDNKNLQGTLAWFVYFYKRKYHRLESLASEIQVMLKHINPSPTTSKNMIHFNTINRLHVSTVRLSNQKAGQWDKFFNTFRFIQKLMNQNVQSESFIDVFRIVCERLTKEERCSGLSETQQSEFINQIQIIAESLDKDKLKEEPIFAIVEQIIKNNIYKPKTIKNRKSKQHIQKQQKVIKKDLSQQQAQKVEKTWMKFTNQPDRILFQTPYKPKGLEFKVVFICSMNFDYEHKPFQYGAAPLNEKERAKNDAERERHRAMDFFRYVVREQQELRVVYTAVTRTSKYCYVTSSIEDCYRKQFTVKHPHFQHLYNNCDNMDYPFLKEEDIEFKKEHKEHTQRSKSKKENKKTQQLKLQAFMQPRIQE